MNCVLVYGNHGHALAVLDDYIVYLEKCFKASGHALKLSAEPQAGATNLLIDQFDLNFTGRAIRNKTPGTQYVLIATEFITGDSFNNFGFNLPAHSQLGKDLKSSLNSVARLAAGLTPGFLRDLASGLFPTAYRSFKSHYHKHSTDQAVVDFNGLRRFWKERFDHFCQMADVADRIWCVSPDQIAGYRDRFGSKVQLLPIVALDQPVLHADSDTVKDIDFLFTGSLTPYRKELLNRLSGAGFNVVTGPADWPAALRQHFLARTKVCLHLRQGAQWRYSSIMRLHHLLSKGCVVLAEKAPFPCAQDAHVQSTVPETIVQDASTELAKGKFIERGRKAAHDYFAAGAAGRQTIAEMIKELSELSGAKQF